MGSVIRSVFLFNSDLLVCALTFLKLLILRISEENKPIELGLSSQHASSSMKTGATRRTRKETIA